MDWKTCLILIIITFTGVVRPHGSLAQENSPSVSYIESSVDNYFMAPGMTFNRDTATIIRKGFDECKCRAACFTISSACMAWTVLTLADGSLECRLTNRGPVDNTPLEDIGATYFFKEISISGSYLWGPDNLLYVELKEHLGFDEGKRRCSYIPGHRLIVIKTMKTYRFFLDFWDVHSSEPFYTLNLKKEGSSLIWGDGTNWRDTELTEYPEISVISEDVFINYQKKLHDASSTYHHPFRILCQANPLGIQW